MQINTHEIPDTVVSCLNSEASVFEPSKSAASHRTSRTRAGGL